MGIHYEARFFYDTTRFSGRRRRGSRLPASGGAGPHSQHRLHPLRRPRLRRSGSLRVEDPHSELRPSGLRGRALHQLLRRRSGSHWPSPWSHWLGIPPQAYGFSPRFPINSPGSREPQWKSWYNPKEFQKNPARKGGSGVYYFLPGKAKWKCRLILPGRREQNGNLGSSSEEHNNCEHSRFTSRSGSGRRFRFDFDGEFDTGQHLSSQYIADWHHYDYVVPRDVHRSDRGDFLRWAEFRQLQHFWHARFV